MLVLIQRKTWLAVLLVFLAASLPVDANQELSALDPRLDRFLVFAIKDKRTLESERKAYASHRISFEQFILSIYTGAVRLDDTADNANALAQLGGYLEKNRPSLSPVLLRRMEEFYAVKPNQTFMRGMFLETIRGIIAPKK
jgi:hypothetical protein